MSFPDEAGMPEETSPLKGYTVIEIGHSVAAPYAGLILGQLGADVIKIENPRGGDAARGWGPPFIDGMGPHFTALNQNKSSVAVDLADEEQCRQLKSLILDRGDVVICNLRAGSADKLGLGMRALLKEKPELIYCELGAFGRGGPLSLRPGYDPLMQAYCGLMGVTGEDATRPPIRVGVSMVDMGAGLWSVIGILAKLLSRRDSGVGGSVETSLFETAIAWMVTPIARYGMDGTQQQPQGSGAAGIVPYQAFRTRSGWLVIAAGNDRIFASLCDVMTRPDLATDPRFLTNGDRVRNKHELLPLIEEFALRYDSDALSALLDNALIPNAPVREVREVVSDEHLACLSLLNDADGGRTVGLPIRFDGRRPAGFRPAPPLGQDTDWLLAPYRSADC